MKHVQALPKKRLLASALLLALSPAIQAAAQEQPAPTSQTANPDADADPTDLDTVVVTGIRASLTSSMNLKRDSQGIVDGIVAEDIGKFPDTNLAEALQRISGVSIDRTSSGEGSKVTVRGVGPDFNLVLLNGRQMPASNLGPGGGGTSNSRSFDFANIAAEAISAIEVHKTGRAELPTGGIGATLNVKTARPLEIGEPLASIGFKAVHDTSARNLPESFPGAIVTPELSGIFSQTYADGKFGIMLSGSYQERESGYSQASVADGWITFPGDSNSWNALPLPGEGYADRITNRPGLDDVYARPQNTGYSVNGVQRQRTNGQLTLQWAPSDNVTATLDYAYMENKVQQQRSELSVWFSQSPGDSSWTDGPVAAPIIYQEEYDGADLSMGGMQLATKNSGDSLGFNVEWEVNDALKLQFDYHNSTAESRPDSHLGSAGVLGMAAYVRGNTTVDYSGEIPIVNVVLPPGMTSPPASAALVTGSVFQNSYNKSEVEQFQADGRFTFGDYSGLDFGVAATEVNNRTAAAVMQRDTWGGVGSPADYDDSIFTPDNMSRYFQSFGNSNNPNWTDGFLGFDFERLRQAAIAVALRDGDCDASCYQMPTEFTNDLRTTEKSKSAYVQWTTTFDWAIPVHVAAGVRYEETEIVSPARVLTPANNSISWDSANELYVTLGDTPEEADFTGKYDYLLPNLDVRADLTEDLVLRGSYSETIGRPGWMDIMGGQTINTLVRVEGGTGTLGNPGLLPLESKNFDLSLEWYYGEASYVSVGYFRKNIKNFISSTIIVDTPYDLHTPVGGAYWNAAVNSGTCPAGDLPCIRDYIFDNFAGSPGVNYTGQNSAGQSTGSIVGQPGDPIANFNITTPANQSSDHLDGFEINVQHVFGDSGFGLAANYTKVDSGLTFDNTDLGTQDPMVGLSDSANLVAFYDKNKWQVRAAYNWRDEFLNGIGGGGVPANPNWTEAYGQLDAIISYEVLENLTLSLEGINLTDETQRIHARHENMVRFATQTGPRYMFGVRYRF